MEIREAAYFVLCIYSTFTCLVFFCILYETQHDISNAYPSSGRISVNGVLEVVGDLSSEEGIHNRVHHHNKIKVEEDEDDLVVLEDEGEDDVVVPEDGDADAHAAGAADGDVIPHEEEKGNEDEGVIPEERGVNAKETPKEGGKPAEERVRANDTEVKTQLGHDLPNSSPTNVSATGYYILDTNQPFTKRCGHCALVSSGGHLYRSRAGADIDSADCVLRMNTAPVTGWREDVGSRTDIRIIGHVNLPRGLVKRRALRNEILSNSTTRTRYVVVPWLRQDKMSMKVKVFKLARQFKRMYPEIDFVFLTRQKNAESEARYKNETGYSRAVMRASFSTGFVSMMFALDICEEVLVYGMSSDDFCKKNPKSKVPYHYYEPTKKSECYYTNKMEMDRRKGHKFLTEHAMFARWSSVRNITFHYPTWRASKASKRVGSHFLKRYKETLKSRKN